MFENLRRGRQARNFTTNAPKILDLKSSSEQIFSRKLPLGAPDANISLGSFHIYGSVCHGCEDVPWTWITLSTLSNIWKIRGWKRIKFLIHKSWRTIKVIGKNYQSGPRAMSCYDLLIWTDSSAFLLCYVTEENCHASRQTNVPPFMDGVLVKYIPCSRLSHSRDYA